jgi:hypothetical protein
MWLYPALAGLLPPMSRPAAPGLVAPVWPVQVFNVGNLPDRHRKSARSGACRWKAADSTVEQSYALSFERCGDRDEQCSQGTENRRVCGSIPSLATDSNAVRNDSSLSTSVPQFFLNELPRSLERGINVLVHPKSLRGKQRRIRPK